MYPIETSLAASSTAKIFIRHDFRREPHYVASFCLQNIPLRGREAHTVPIKISFQLAGIPQRLSHSVAEITKNQLPLIYDPGRPRPRDGAPTLNRKLISGKWGGFFTLQCNNGPYSNGCATRVHVSPLLWNGINFWPAGWALPIQSSDADGRGCSVWPNSVSVFVFCRLCQFCHSGQKHTTKTQIISGVSYHILTFC